MKASQAEIKAGQEEINSCQDKADDAAKPISIS
jgi:hypothetical protein